MIGKNGNLKGREDENFVQVHQIQCVHAVLFAMMCEFDRICREEGYAYSLAGGTLLGALRYGDFIPWDDDADLFMLREDYDKFVRKYAGCTYEGGYYRVIDMNTGFDGQTFARMVDLRTETQSKLSTTFKNLWIDILPLDNIPDKLSERESYGEEMRTLRKWRVLFNAPPMASKRKRTLFMKVIRTIVGVVARKTPLRKYICNKISITATRYRDDSTKEAAEIVAQGWIKGTVCVETFRDSVDIELRGKKFKAMPDYNHYLTGQYGNYMIPPKKHVAHGINVLLDIDQYEGNLKEELLYYIERRDLEEENRGMLEEKQRLEEELRQSDPIVDINEFIIYDRLQRKYVISGIAENAAEEEFVCPYYREERVMR